MEYNYPNLAASSLTLIELTSFAKSALISFCSSITADSLSSQEKSLTASNTNFGDLSPDSKQVFMVLCKILMG
jgi:hypothetical protein